LKPHVSNRVSAIKEMEMIGCAYAQTSTRVLAALNLEAEDDDTNICVR